MTRTRLVTLPCITLILSRPVSVCLELITPPSGLHYLREQICHRISSPLSLSGSYRFTGLTSSTTCPYSSVFLLDDPCLRLDSHRTPFPHAARPCKTFNLILRRKLLCFTCEHGLGQKTTPCYFVTTLATTFSFATTLSISALE